jgi:hypothetical protein
MIWALVFMLGCIHCACTTRPAVDHINWRSQPITDDPHLAVDRTAPTASLEVIANPIQPSGAPILLTVTVKNTGSVPISYWWCGPGGYPDTEDFSAMVTPLDPWQASGYMALSNGQYFQATFNSPPSGGSGRLVEVSPGRSVSFPAAIVPVPCGVYRISVAGHANIRVNHGQALTTWPVTKSAKRVTVEIRDDAGLAAARDTQVLAGVRANDPFAKHVASNWPRMRVREALIEDLMGDNIVQADCAAEGLWGNEEAPPADAPIVTRAILKHLKPPEGATDVGLMEKLLRGSHRPDSIELQHAVVRLAAGRPGTQTREFAVTLMNLPDSDQTLDTGYDIGVFHVGPNPRAQGMPEDVATLRALYRLAISDDARERKIAFRSLADYADDSVAARAIRVGVNDPESHVSEAARDALEKLKPDNKFAPVNPADLERAIEKAQLYLLSRQVKDGSWETVDRKIANGGVGAKKADGRPWGVHTAVAVYALLESGKSPDDPQMQSAIKFLLQAPIESTYALGFDSQIAAYIPEKQAKEFLKRNVAMLLGGLIQPPAEQIKNSKAWAPDVGFYGYWTGDARGAPFRQLKPQPAGWYDRGNSEAAAMGMDALTRAGGEVPTLYWQIVDAAWKKAQLLDGSWNYRANLPGSADMTAAGIATLLTTQDYTLEANWAECHGGRENLDVKGGLTWLDKNIADGLLKGDFYTRYCIARAGLIAGRTRFGNIDWFEAGAAWLLATQAEDGSWNNGRDTIADTAYALLFLSMGHHPIAINKLEYQTSKAPKGEESQWNQRPRDVANLVRWASHDQNKQYSWREVTLQSSQWELDQAPVLGISGSEAIDFAPADILSLKGYIERGGMILGNADCGRDGFSKSFVELGRQMFPQLKFRQLEPNDPLFNGVAIGLRGPRPVPRVMALSDGKRNLMLLVPDSDPARDWQSRSVVTREASFRLGANIIQQ